MPEAYLPKLNSYLQKNKYTTTFLNNNTELHLQIGDLFKYTLSQEQLSESDQLKHEIAQMRQANQETRGQQKLFRYFILMMWNQKAIKGDGQLLVSNGGKALFDKGLC